MALIACPDCSTEVSDQAPACPKCARPIAPSGALPRREMSPWIKWPLGILGGLFFLPLGIFGGMFFLSLAAQVQRLDPVAAGSSDVDATKNSNACTISHWTWDNHSIFVQVEGIIEPPGERELFIQGFDQNGNLLGVRTTRTKPDGQFSTILGNGPNPTDEMEIKYSCK